MTATAKTIFATFSYAVGEAEVKQTIRAEVAATSPWRQWLMPLEDKAHAILESENVSTGTLRFRLDGSDTPLTWYERVADWWHSVTWRGVGYTGSRFIINWDAPAGC